MNEKLWICKSTIESFNMRRARSGQRFWRSGLRLRHSQHTQLLDGAPTTPTAFGYSNLFCSYQLIKIASTKYSKRVQLYQKLQPLSTLATPTPLLQLSLTLYSNFPLFEVSMPDSNPVPEKNHQFFTCHELWFCKVTHSSAHRTISHHILLKKFPYNELLNYSSKRSTFHTFPPFFLSFSLSCYVDTLILTQSHDMKGSSQWEPIRDS